MCTLEEKSWSETVAELKQKFVVTYKVSWYPSLRTHLQVGLYHHFVPIGKW